MESEDIIDWDNIEFEFEEDETYETINAPKWVDLSTPIEAPEDETWFCKSGCKHPRTVEEFIKLKQNFKVKLLKSLAISEFHPFRDINRRETKTKRGKKESKLAGDISEEDTENKNPNLSNSAPDEDQVLKLKKTTAKSTTEKRLKSRIDMDDDSEGNRVKNGKKPGLRSTFSARNLVGGREFLNQITDFCAELKKLARKGSKKAVYEKI